MSDVRYSVEIAYFTKGKVRNPLTDQQRDYDRSQARAFNDAIRRQRELRREEERRIRAGNRLINERMREESRARTKKEIQGRLLGNMAGGGMIAVGGVASSISNAIISGVAGAATTVGGLFAAGLTTTLKTGVTFADQMERAQISFAAMQKMQLGGTWRQNSLDAAKAVEAARKDAAALPGEMTDILDVMKTLATPAMQSGMSMSQVQKMSSDLVAMAEIEGLSPKVAASQAARILQGRMTANNNFGLRLGFDQDVMGRKGKMKPEDRAAILAKTLHEGAAPALADFQASWRGLTSTIADNWRNVAKSFAQPLITSLKGSMARGLEWFTANQDRVHEVATRFGSYLEFAFQRGTDFVQRWYQPVLNFGENLYQAVANAFERASPLISGMGEKVMGFMEDPKAFEKIEEFAKTVALMKAGGAGLSFAGGGVRTILPMLGAGGMGVGAASMTAAGALAVLGVEALGLYDILSDGNNTYHKGAKSNLDEIKFNFERIFDASSGLRQAADAFAAACLASGKFITGNIAMLGDITGELIDVLKEAASRLHLYTPELGPDPTEHNLPPWEFIPPPKSMNWNSEDEDREKRKKVVPNHTTHIHNVEIKVNSNQDPTRVARATVKELNNLARNPKVSPGAAGSNVSF